MSLCVNAVLSAAPVRMIFSKLANSDSSYKFASRMCTSPSPTSDSSL